MMAEWAALGLGGASFLVGQSQAAQRQKAEAAMANADALARSEALDREQADMAAAREKKLKMAIASGNAGAAGAGISPDGSAAAIIAGMNADNADQAMRERQRFQSARADVSRAAANRVRMSLLDFNDRNWNSILGLGRSVVGFMDARERKGLEQAKIAKNQPPSTPPYNPEPSYSRYGYPFWF